jgi:site-specific DNA-methyltransferase (adenine-specific)
MLGPCSAHLGDAVDVYPTLEPGYSLIVSDGAYGIGGFPGDPKTPHALAEWYAPHLAAWDRLAAPSSSLYFWCTPEGCARMLPHVEAAGWRLYSRIVWNKGMAALAGRLDTAALRGWPVASEDCYFYVREAWDPAGATARLRAAGHRPEDLDAALGVACVASRKYLGSDRQAYPPTDADLQVLRRAFPCVLDFAPASVRYPFILPVGVTDVWSGLPVNRPGRHSCAKRDDHTERIVAASSRPGDRVLEPFGGGAPVLRACRKLGRSCDSIERDPEWHSKALAALETRPQDTATAGQPSLFGATEVPR